MVTTLLPSGDTCDMKATRNLPPSFPRNVLQATTSSLRTVVWGRMDTRAYSPLSFSGPSTSMPERLAVARDGVAVGATVYALHQ